MHTNEVVHAHSKCCAHSFQVLLVASEIKKKHVGIKKGIIEKYSWMITSSSTREHGAGKRWPGEAVKIAPILEGYMDYKLVPKACKEVYL
jgi:hypothetical protein